MLIDLLSGKEIVRVPFGPKFRIMQGRLSSTEFDAIEHHINALIDESGGEIATAGWLPWE